MNEPERQKASEQLSDSGDAAGEAVGLLMDLGGEFGGVAVEAAQTGAEAVSREIESAVALASDEVPAMLAEGAEVAGDVADAAFGVVGVIGEIIGGLFG